MNKIRVYWINGDTTLIEDDDEIKIFSNLDCNLTKWVPFGNFLFNIDNIIMIETIVMEEEKND